MVNAPNLTENGVWFQTFLASAVERLQNNNADNFLYEVLIVNLKIMKNSNLEILPSIKTHLVECVSQCFKNYDSAFHTEDELSNILHFITQVLQFLHDKEKTFLFEILFPELILKSKNLLEANNLPELIRILQLIELLLAFSLEDQINFKFDKIISSPLKELISKLLLLNDAALFTNSLSLFSLITRYSQCSPFTYLIWSNISDKAMKDDDFAEKFLVILMYILRSSAKSEDKFRIIVSKQLWFLLKKCLFDDLKSRKYALAVLKYIVFNICNHDESEKNCEIWKSKHSKNYNSWWETYFIITDTLEEKQTHLISPVFSLIRNLTENKIVKLDLFWILNVINLALQHDSRYVRIEAFICLFSLKFNVKTNHSHLILKMICSLNDSTIIRKIFKMNKFEEFRNQFVNWMVDFFSKAEDHFGILLDEVMVLKWSHLPLYYLLKFISECDHNSQLDMEPDSEKVKNFIKYVANMQNVIIRIATQNLFIDILTRHLKRDVKAFKVFLQILNHFNNEECLLRGSHSWTNVTRFVIQATDFYSIEEYIMTCIEIHVERDERSSNKTLLSLARDILLFEDAFRIHERSRLVGDYMIKIATSFEKTMSNPYFNVKIQDNYLTLAIFLIKIENGDRYTGSKVDKTSIYKVIQSKFTYILSYITQRMCKTNEISRIDFYKMCLENLNVHEFSLCDREFVGLISDCVTMTCHELFLRNGTSRYSSLIILLWIYDFISSHEKTVVTENWRSAIDYKMIEYTEVNKQKSFILDYDSKNNSRASSQYTDLFWKLFTFCTCINYEHVHRYVGKSLIFCLIFESFDLARPENLSSIFHSLKNICKNETYLNEKELMGRLIVHSWKCLVEIKSTQHYLVSAQNWARTFVQKSFFQIRIFQWKVTQYVEELLIKAEEDGRQSFTIVVSILEALENIENLHTICPQISEILVHAFCITHIIRKDQRIEYATVDQIRSSFENVYLNSKILESDFVHSSDEVRLRALNLLLKISEGGSDSPDICVAIIELLTVPEDSVKKRYFGNSLFHRTKHKKLQLLLIFETILHRKSLHFNEAVIKCYEKIYKYVIHTLLIESHQPSVRYMLEWLLIRIVIHQPGKFVGDFWHSFSEETGKRIGSICSFISVAFHLANVLDEEKFIEKAVKMTLPWAMSQYFNARLYAQTVLVKLINLNSNLKTKFEYFESGVNSCLRRGNAVKNAVKLSEDFYFSYFNPLNNFTLQVILWDLPRLSNISRDEWIASELYDKYLSVNCGFPIRDECNSLSQFTCSSWVAKASAVLYLENDEREERSLNVNGTQKKFIPIENDVIDNKQLKRSNLIVVASLVDKAPNLGGLTRTCEIFAVGALVVDNLEIIRNKEFRSLSITAEKHLPLIEVKHFNLFKYLKNIKEKGYCVIGVEQTTNSKSLDKFSFPLNSIIVLGNEKKGIPADLLPVLDVCIEVPQRGVIRSLNVHVSGSMIIWEYSKQHLL